MSEFKGIGKIKFERLLGMSSGYVLDFSNRTFQEFVKDVTGRDIYSDKYGSGSKANQLRGFWQAESNYNVAKINLALLELWKTNNLLNKKETSQSEEQLYEECKNISELLRYGTIGEHIDAIHPNSDEKDFSVLAQAIRESIEKNEPENALDRLHTFVVKYIHRLCDNHEIEYDRTKALHSYFGEYIKYLKKNNKIESEMTERILKSSISVLEAFNSVRNDNSFAHDNPILNHNESMLIFKNIASIIEFIDSIEKDNKIESDIEFLKSFENGTIVDRNDEANIGLNYDLPF